MKKFKLYLLLLLLPLLPIGCDDMHDYIPPTGDETHISEVGTAEMYVLSEGLFNLNNSTLTRYTFGDSRTVSDYFTRINGRGLGDTANDMAIYGTKLYIVVNVSSQVEVVDLPTGRSLKRIPLLAENGSSKQPRYIAFHEDKAYVCAFDGTVARINTTTLTVDGYATAGRNPDGICVQNGKLYVSNSGGLDQPDYDNSVSVIDLSTFRETKKIIVGENPGKIVPDHYGNVFVAVRGNVSNPLQGRLVKIDTRTDEVVGSLDEPVLNFAINEDMVYLYSYNHSTGESEFKVYNIASGTIERQQFIADGTQINTPYAIHINPYSGNVYIADAFDYLVKGDVLCFDQQGYLQFRLPDVGINPNSIVFSDRASQSKIDDEVVDPNAPSAYANRVLEYMPAPGQFINTATGIRRDGFSLLSLGGFGGYIVLGFDHTVPNMAGAYDFKIYGNASYNSKVVDAKAGSSEPGIVLVSKDTNGNGLPDDEWYELAGSEYNSNKVIRDYEITYYRPSDPLQDVRWTDNQGREGVVPRNIYHTTNAYYPEWVEEDELTFRGSRLPDNGVDDSASGLGWIQYAFAWGYADNHPNNTEGAQFNIEWAVDHKGAPVALDGIDFVKIYTAVNQECGWMGETSTEVSKIEDLHFNK